MERLAIGPDNAPIGMGIGGPPVEDGTEVDDHEDALAAAFLNDFTEKVAALQTLVLPPDARRIIAKSGVGMRISYDRLD